ncbi:hypothetical protein A2765_00490 [Candidatus Kaiserbacteria bacterium RIFCSPHIGHO2_01_FULL_56_24]|uniref:Uncharacterized protein n=1 Tax=Candidatus Kaiserbacteria bacterium RIFCSPHIGHO2_01_FULL_56_24 TaxID=1798487 RepID=A0A1F6DBS8_9BACT|nr:MAG: hypothetical protein A2765_00490 [Candidatus Kaiserbacteria bacterium RIFCSPHIGHO2_01_FULL_56_24]
MKEFGGPVGRKYASIDLKGRDAVEKGEIQDFIGYPEALKNRFCIALELSADSDDEIRERVTSKVEAIAKESGIHMVIAGRNYPLHSTLLEGNFDGTDEAKRDGIFAALIQDPELQKVFDELKDLKIVYKYLLVDKGNILLTCSDIPEAFARARQRISEIYMAHGLKPLMIEHLAHISIARITRQPDVARLERLHEYKTMLIKLRHEISSNPITADVGDIFKGPTHDFLFRINLSS